MLLFIDGKRETARPVGDFLAGQSYGPVLRGNAQLPQCFLDTCAAFGFREHERVRLSLVQSIESDPSDMN